MFRSVTVYQLTQATSAVLKRLDKALESKPFKPCGDHAAKSRGFVKPLGPTSDVITYDTNGGTLFRLRTDEKLLPAAAVKEMVELAVQSREKAGEELSPVDVRQIKEEITENLLPSVIPAPSWTYAYIDKELAMLFVGASDDGADEFIDAMKGALNAAPPVKLLGIEADDPSGIFTEWLRDTEKLGEAFSLGHSCSLKHAKEGGTAVINIQHDELESDEMAAMLDAGKECCRVALEHQDMDFAITAKLGIRSISLSDDKKAEIVESADGQQIVNEFATFVPVMRDVVLSLEPLLGGWPKQEVLDLDGEEEA